MIPGANPWAIQAALAKERRSVLREWSLLRLEQPARPEVFAVLDAVYPELWLDSVFACPEPALVNLVWDWERAFAPMLLPQPQQAARL